MARYLLRDGRIIFDGMIVDYDATHTNPIHALTLEEYEKFVERKLEDRPEVELADVMEDPDKPTDWKVIPWEGDKLKQALLAEAANQRWLREQAGFTIETLTVATDDRSKLMLLGARALAEIDPAFTTQWALPDGTSVQLRADQIIAISLAVAKFVDECFKTYAQLVTEIQSGQVTTLSQVRVAYAG